MWRRLLLAVVLFFAVSGAYAWWTWSPGAPPHPVARAPLAAPLRGSAEHDATRARFGEPYVFEHGALLYYGASHSNDPGHPQVADIRARWEAFRPTVALCEGRARGYIVGRLLQPFVGLPEPALVHRLAREDGVRLVSLEPSYADEVAALLEDFSPEQVALFFTLRVVFSEAGGDADEDLFEELRAKRTDVDGLRAALPDVAAADRLWATLPEGTPDCARGRARGPARCRRAPGSRTSTTPHAGCAAST